MAARVWVSIALVDVRLFRDLSSNLELEPSADTQRRNERGEAMPPERFPTQLYGAGRRRLSPLLSARGHLVVSSELADVLRRFDLGRTSLYPVDVFREDDVTPAEGKFFCLNVGEVKRTFLPEQSRVRKPDPTHEKWALPIVLRDDDIALGASALEGPEVWVEAQLRGALLLSDRLVRAIRDAGLGRGFSFRRCRIA